MKIDGKHHQSIWINENNEKLIQVFDQRLFPHEIKIFNIQNTDAAIFAIKEMVVRGAPLIGVTAAYGLYLACLEAQKESNPDIYIEEIARKLAQTRPTAVNLVWAINEMLRVIHQGKSVEEKINIALQKANEIKKEDIEICFKIGEYGLFLIKKIAESKQGKTVNILTHCNAGWLATIDWGTATSPMYQAQQAEIDIHVWVDETRPRNQGANLTAFELNQQGIPHTLITDNTGGHLMQHGMVDMVIVGTDRTTRNGDVANKIGTYLKALAAYDNNIPFYVALPSSTLDCSIADGIKEISIETRDQNEVKYIQGKVDGEIKSVLICPETTSAINYGFDITPAKYVTGLITERGICKASEEGIRSLFPEKF
ncbi:methylthioribose-1-phosphate isomerase [Geminocystis sp. NIES-3708]|uniref:S-methyl-5-thioribose-1-phosphate isomerase n=1 Tax=Geminocystis sp. NIES-3708 TaxID=1615909 RepID=UPI0005FC3EB3|nr:S-methyl-5-thioribose-1-phosphate isomerase [Geminocystis sp. NIES-3708]BAQ62279.1 methylthioribose-1-phosphate isomerase [Geminocystis sp. NIES-3708]